MRDALKFLPLLILAPLGRFLGSYLDGAGVLPRSSGFLVSAACIFLLPWVVAALFFRVRASWPIRVALFTGALAVQFILVFTAVPSGATSQMMGIAHRLRREFPSDEMRACASNLRLKKGDGTLVVRQAGKEDFYLMRETAVLVSDSELPVQLRGRFKQVFIQPDPNSGEQQVCFALDERTGIICDSRKGVREFFVYSMADGVHAYRYQRP